jgi:CheY-like chemotaxis protein/tetratricopeptide (TPR) repeat protein
VKAILVVEHHAATAESLRQALLRAGHGVRCARTPHEALALYASERPDAVVLAADFPRHEGKSLGALLRGMSEGRSLPLLAVDKAHLGPSRAAGVRAVLEFRPDGYFPDGSRTDDILARLKAALGRSAGPSQPTAARPAWAQTLERPPVQATSLEKDPLPEVLHGLWRLRRDGVLVVATGAEVRRLFLLEGAPVAFDTDVPGEDFASHLERAGLMPQAEARRLAAMRGLGPWKLALQLAGGPLGAEAFQPAWAGYVRAMAASLLRLRGGQCAFYAGAEFREGVDLALLPALAPVLDGARRLMTARDFAAALKGLGKRYPHRTPEFAGDLPALGLDVEDVKFALQLNGHATTRELLAGAPGELHRRWSLLWFLRLTGDVAFAPAAFPAGDVGGPPAPAAPRRHKQLKPELAAELREGALQVITGSYFHALGLGLGADTAEVERAYAERVQRFHPDSYPDQDLSGLEDLFLTVQERLGAARRVLGSPEKRRAYLAHLVTRSGLRTAEPVPEAEVELWRGHGAMLRGDWAAARRAFDLALALNPREPAYYPLAAWATWMAGPRPVRERGVAALALLKKALALDPELPRAHLVAAVVELELGETVPARARLERLLLSRPGWAPALAAWEALSP